VSGNIHLTMVPTQRKTGLTIFFIFSVVILGEYKLSMMWKEHPLIRSIKINQIFHPKLFRIHNLSFALRASAQFHVLILIHLVAFYIKLYSISIVNHHHYYSRNQNLFHHFNFLYFKFIFNSIFIISF